MFSITGKVVQLLTCADRAHLLDVLLQLHAGLSYYLVVVLHHLRRQEGAFGAYSLASRWCGVAWGQPDRMILIYTTQEYISKLKWCKNENTDFCFKRMPDN